MDKGSIERGLKGRNEYIGFAIDLSGFIALIFNWTFLFGIYFDFGIKKSIALFILGQIFGMLSAILFPLFFSQIFLWIFGTIVMVISMAFISTKISWFGFF
jgi:hypothetical protein